MKIIVEKNDLTHDALVNLLSTALYGNDALMCLYSLESYNECDQSDDDCLEDKLAKILLSGRVIEICDLYAEEEDERYGNIDSHWYDDGGGMMSYRINLDNIVEGLNRAADDGKTSRVFDILNDCEMCDMEDSYMLMQYIMFGEVVYG